MKRVLTDVDVKGMVQLSKEHNVLIDTTLSNGTACISIDDESATGDSSDVVIRGVAAPQDGNDAVNMDYVDRAMADVAHDNQVVHKSGNLSETITGKKQFNGDVVVGENATLELLSGQDDGVYIDCIDNGGVQEVAFAGMSDDSAVRLNNVADPVNDFDAVNKRYVDNLVLWRQNIPYVKYPVPFSQVLTTGDIAFLTVATIDRGADAAGNYYGLFLMNATLSLYDSAATPSQGEHMVTIEMMARITNDQLSWSNIYGNKMVYGVGEPNANTTYRSFNMSSLINLNTSYRYISFIVKIRNLGSDEITLGADGSGSTSAVSVVNLGIPVNFI